jgi:hypothetical protein
MAQIPNSVDGGPDARGHHPAARSCRRSRAPPVRTKKRSSRRSQLSLEAPCGLRCERGDRAGGRWRVLVRHGARRRRAARWSRERFARRPFAEHGAERRATGGRAPRDRARHGTGAGASERRASRAGDRDASAGIEPSGAADPVEIAGSEGRIARADYGARTASHLAGQFVRAVKEAFA